MNMINLSCLCLIISASSYLWAQEIVSHKGVHVPFRQEVVVGPRDCVATFIEGPRHLPEKWRYILENTVEAIEMGFSSGASIVTVNLQATKDGEVVLQNIDHLCEVVDWKTGKNTFITLMPNISPIIKECLMA